MYSSTSSNYSDYSKSQINYYSIIDNDIEICLKNKPISHSIIREQLSKLKKNENKVYTNESISKMKHKYVDLIIDLNVSKTNYKIDLSELLIKYFNNKKERYYEKKKILQAELNNPSIIKRSKNQSHKKIKKPKVLETIKNQEKINYNPLTKQFENVVRKTIKGYKPIFTGKKMLKLNILVDNYLTTNQKVNPELITLEPDFDNIYKYKGIRVARELLSNNIFLGNQSELIDDLSNKLLENNKILEEVIEREKNIKDETNKLIEHIINQNSENESRINDIKSGIKSMINDPVLSDNLNKTIHNIQYLNINIDGYKNNFESFCKIIGSNKWMGFVVNRTLYDSFMYYGINFEYLKLNIKSNMNITQIKDVIKIADLITIHIGIKTSLWLRSVLIKDYNVKTLSTIDKFVLTFGFVYDFTINDLIYKNKKKLNNIVYSALVLQKIIGGTVYSNILNYLFGVSENNKTTELFDYSNYMNRENNNLIMCYLNEK